jgi:PEP-CTERM motif
MKSVGISSLIFALASLVVAPAFATPPNLITLGPGTSTSVAAGQSFNLNIGITAAQPFDGLSLYLLSSTASAFNVTGRSNVWSGTNALTDPSTADTSIVGFLPKTGQSKDFGYTSTTSTNSPAGTYAVETLTISTPANLTPGQYTISSQIGASGSELSDSSFNEFDFPQATFTVNVSAPEPASLALLVFGSAGLLMRRRKTAC